MPILRLVYLLPPAEAAGISLVMVVANAISGSLAYLRHGRVDVRAAVLVATTGIPASFLGAYLVRFASKAIFDVLLGCVLAAFFAILVRRRREGASKPLRSWLAERTLVDRSGESFRYGTNVPLVLGTGIVLGLASSFLGIGGGTVFGLFFIGIFGMPPEIVNATSTLAILLTAPAGVATHALQHDVDWTYALPLAFGGFAGGQIGPRIARRLSSPRLLDVMAGTILLAAIALVLKHIPLGR